MRFCEFPPESASLPSIVCRGTCGNAGNRRNTMQYGPNKDPEVTITVDYDADFATRIGIKRYLEQAIEKAEAAQSG